jgi:predicted alpha/beta-fold hydrolase
LIPTILLVIILIQGWSESGAWKNSLLKKLLENIPGVAVVVPDYLDGKGRFAQFKSHLIVEEYSFSVRFAIIEAKRNYPNATIMVVGHSLGGVIARYLCAEGIFQAKNMILVGTPIRELPAKHLEVRPV